MRTATYRCLQLMATALCAVSTVAFAQAAARPSLYSVLSDVGIGDWAVTALVSLSFGLVSLLQRFKASEAGDKYILFVAAHMGGSLISGIMVYLVTQAAFDEPNRFIQALAIGAAGWGGSTVADRIAAKVNEKTVSKE